MPFTVTQDNQHLARSPMPFTPLHMGAGMAVKAVAPRQFSLVAFGLSQVAMDIEPLVRIVRGDPVVHGTTHTCIGALAVALAAFPLIRFAYPLLSRWWNHHAGAHRLSALLMPVAPPALPVVLGVGVGTLSHVVIDSIMHSDLAPFWPFSAASPLHGVVSIDLLHLLCVGAGVLGLLAFLGLGRLRERRYRAR